ncbi:hypothetical protein I2486_07655 [Cellulophaga sp. E16_2]|uniref:hypothetical protein n=1 Tax=Cellulophaga sp. E16_2 TaxID=2789297 RepID=UPI001A914C57|nr:hypothetical protein [Cellulophaga sp. E16_2]MBO0591282.1 hypothetical protein [Cellulophaga sp. E16_2]
MKYYNIGLSDNISVIGCYPQTERTKKNEYHINSYNSELKVANYEFPEFTPKYGIDLCKNAIATDILDRATLDFGLVVNERVKNILENYILPPHRFYPINVFGQSKYDYYWFHYITPFNSIINIENCEIEVFDKYDFIIIEILRFNNLSELQSFSKEMIFDPNNDIRYKSIQLKSTFPKYDLFEITGAQYFTLISAKLKERLDIENITGLEFLEYSKVNFSHH